MSSLDFDLDSQMCSLESEWRIAYEASVVARAEYQALFTVPKVSATLVNKARKRLDQAEALKGRIMARIERLEDNILGKD